MLLKEVYGDEFLKALAAAILKFDAQFNAKKFLKIDLRAQELKQRMRSITLALDESLSPKKYQQKVEVLKKAVVAISKDKNSGLALIIFPDFVEVFGVSEILKQVQDDKIKNRHPELVSGSIEIFNFSMQALEFFTEFGSSEFAVRQFIKLDSKHALTFFKKWTKSENYHVRRLASEGCRPRLPWGEALPIFKKDPTEILPILENLKCDESEYVRKSVANNLNDISKDNPEVVLELLAKWQGEVSERLTIHALRTLLKKGDQRALKLIGIERNILSENFAIESFSLQKAVVKISQDLSFDFALHSKAPNNKIRLEYAVHFLMKNGSLTKKNFQITTKNFAKGVFSFTKKHSFRDLSTRKHNAGRHLISLVVNGLEVDKLEFNLI
ncbi:MAG: DNA alkylation repair protein [Rickettsiales bacterium]|nr:DNA alkylation repair protein [Rickettsiales bacterium]